MDPKSFLQRLYGHIWNYKIALEEFNAHYAISMNEDAPYYDPEDFYASQIYELLNDIKKDYLLTENYNKVKSFLPSSDRSRVIDFMSWYSIHKDDTFNDIYVAENYNEGYNTDFIIRLMELLNEPPLSWNSQKEVRTGTAVQDIISVLRRFTSTVGSLTKRRKDKLPIAIKDEYDVQDLLLVMLKSKFPLTRSETVVDGKTGREFLKIDFLIPDHKIAVECKYPKSISTSELRKQIADDMLTYNEHPDCRELIFFIFDDKLALKDAIHLEKHYTKKFQFGEHLMNVSLVISPQ